MNGALIGRKTDVNRAAREKANPYKSAVKAPLRALYAKSMFEIL